MRITRFTSVITISHVHIISQALNEIKQQYGEIIEYRNYYYNDVEFGNIDEKTLRKNLREADIVLIDVRSAGRTEKILVEELKNASNTVIALVAPVVELLGLTRMGSFKASVIRSKDFGFDESYRDMKSVFKMQKMIKKLGT
ncbi:MAG: hypothetical protein AB1633_02165, partial [Elusimicrobiota bacterium]